VSNLPTVWTNVLVGLALGGWSGDRPWLAVLALAAGSLLYTGGMLLNDVMDASWDRAHKRDRPIAEGRLSDRLAGSLAMGCLFGGVGLAASRGDQAAGFAGALVAAIVLYNWLHKRSPLAVVFMAGCRALLYPLAAFMISGEPVHAVWPVSAAVGVYTVLLTLAARREDRAGATVSRAIAWLVPAPFLKHPKGIRDITEWYISIRARPDYIHAVFSKQCEVALGNLERIHARIGDLADIAFICGTDFGTQTSAFCSVETFRDLWFPYYKQVNDWIHRNTNWKTFKHSCGAVEPIIELLADSGFDILNPVQCSASGMDPKLLKEKHGERITFWGGGVNTQKTLPFGTPEEVRQEVLARCETFAPGGGFIFNSIHNVQALTPTENMVAMLDAVNEYNG